jgi:DNA-binding transcriptional ArsR family regulator
MPTGKLMTMKEKTAIDMQVIALRDAGKVDEARELTKTIPLSPALCALYKKRLGAYWLKNSGRNLAEAEAKFGNEWLNH